VAGRAAEDLGSGRVAGCICLTFRGQKHIIVQRLQLR
jgi:hypothetical protein